MNQHGIRLRPATEQDFPFLVRLRQLAMGPHRTAAGIPETEEQVHAKVRTDFEAAAIIVHRDEAIGLFKARRDSSPWSILQIQILPSWQGRGIGTCLVEQFVAQARTLGQEVELSVLKVNPALRLYQRQGFSIVSASTHGFTLRTGIGAEPTIPT